MASSFYAVGLKKIVDDGIASLTPKVTLCLSSYSPDDQDTITQVNAAKATLSGGDLAATLSSENDSGNTRIEVDVTNGPLTFSSVAGGQTIQYAVLYDDDTTDTPICYWDRGSGLATNGGDITLTFDTTNGNIRLGY